AAERDSYGRLTEGAQLVADLVKGTSCRQPPTWRAVVSGVLHPTGGGDWVSAGDAAVSFDPVSSLGLGSALHSGALAARVAHARLNGDRDLLFEYECAISRVFRQYSEIRRALYQMERRWEGRGFWQRRTNERVAAGAQADLAIFPPMTIVRSRKGR